MQPATEIFWITKLTTRKKNWTHEIHTRKKKLDSWNTQEENFRTHKYLQEKFRTHEYPQEKILDPLNAHEKKI